MNTLIRVKSYTPPPCCKKEALRYAGVKEVSEPEDKLFRSAYEEAESVLSYRVCYAEFPLKISGDVCDFEVFKTESAHLAKNLTGCGKAVIFAATVGIGIDRLIAKYSRLSPAKAVILDGIGAERIEALCDAFCSEYPSARPRFSPGYGDLSIEVQKEVFEILDLPRHIGVSLNESLMMSPTKSVTAVMGIKE